MHLLLSSSQTRRWVLCGMALPVASFATPGCPGQQAEVEHYSGSASERVQAAVAAWTAKLGSARASGPMTQRQTPKGEYAGVSGTFASDRFHLHAFVALGDNDGVCHLILSPADAREKQTMKSTLAECLNRASDGAVARGNPPVGSSNTSQPHAASASSVARGKRGADIPASTPTPSHPENWSHVRGVYFRSSYQGGVGGAITITYQPVVLLDDGTAYETRQAALEDIDFAQERTLHPKDWSRWQQNGATFTLTDERGRPEQYKLQDGSFFRARSAEDGGPLNGTYESVGGGGNSALGGELAIMYSDRMTFTPDGRFTTGQDTAISGSGSQSGVSIGGGASHKMHGVGSYKASRYTLTTQLPDGTQVRRFFCYSSQGQNAQVDKEMIFVGDTPYTRK